MVLDELGKHLGIGDAHRIRTHSGRRHAVSMMVMKNVDEHIGMRYACMKDRKTYSMYANDLSAAHLLKNTSLVKAAQKL